MKRFILLGTAILTMSVNLMAQECSELFISEYLEGSGNNKGVEIYNPTSGIINLGAYYVARYSNGKNTYTDGGITQLEGFIQAYSTHLMVNGQTTSTETSPASDPNLRALAQQLDHDYPAPTYMNGNDAIALFRDTGGSGDVNDFVLVDLFGIIGGGMPSDGAGWAAFTDEWTYKNIWEDDSIVGRDSVYITNFIVPDGYWWLPWSSNHSLVRKPGVKQGVGIETMPTVEFDVTVEWDTVPGGVDVWDSLNAHTCDCEIKTLIEGVDPDQHLKIFPNPASDRLIVSFNDGMDELEVSDLAGKRIFLYREMGGVEEKVLHLESLPPGIYLIKVHSRERTFTKKLIRR